MLVTLASGAGARGHDVAFAAHPGPLSATLRCPVFDLPMIDRRLRRLPAAAWAVGMAVRRWRPDVVHAQNPGMAVAVALPTLRGRRVAAVAGVQGVPDGDYPATARALRFAGLPVVACGAGVGRRLGSVGLHPHAVIENAVGPAPAPMDRGVLARRFGLPADRRIVVAVGRLVPQKNLELAVEALRGVPDAALLIVGEGPSRVSIEACAARCGVAERVRLAGARDDAREILGAADVVVVPSRWEGLPLVVLEAMAAGRPVVATDVTGIPDLVDDGVTGLLVPSDDAEGMARAMRRILEDGALASLLGERASAAVAGRSDAAMVAAYLAVYDGLPRRSG